MIIDTKRFNETSAGSAVKILVRCDHCGIERYAVKQNLLRRPDFMGQCRPCYLKSEKAQQVRSNRYISPEARERIGAAAKGRPTSDHKRRRLSEVHSGIGNRRWNPDREQVARNRRARTECYRLLEGCLRRINRRKTGKAERMLGYTGLELMAHIEALFLPGMSWLDRRAWHIDHIKPVSRFVADGIADVKIINALSNLQPLWAKDNLAKRELDRIRVG